MDRPLIPELLLEDIDQHFDTEVAERLKVALIQESSVSVRVNTRKPTDQFNGYKPVHWSSHSFVLPTRPDFHRDPLLHAGTYYVQDASSMILEWILDELPLEQESILALDACAAPGGKSIILSDFLEKRGMLIANEIQTKRNHILQENLMKWGASNAAVTQLSADSMASSGVTFDLMMIDAPCSGEGMFRKDPFAVQQWSPALRQQCEIVQDDILQALAPQVNESGYLIYSTCTFNRGENEQQVSKLRKLGFVPELPRHEPLSEYLVPVYDGSECIGWYLLPGISLGEGLFISVWKRIDGPAPSRGKSKALPFDQTLTQDLSEAKFTHQWSLANTVFGYDDPHDRASEFLPILPLKSLGLPIAERKGKDIIPLHGLAMQADTPVNIELNLEDALQYLKKDRISATPKEVGWMTVGFKQHPLGWIKSIGNRTNNNYPKEFRIKTT